LIVAWSNETKSPWRGDPREGHEGIFFLRVFADDLIRLERREQRLIMDHPLPL
jgi:hypothetical protein